jgi:hypothetical protein
MQDFHNMEESVAPANRLISAQEIDEGLVTSRQYPQETKYSQHIIKGDSSRHIQAEYTSKMSTVLTDDEEVTKWSAKKEASLSDNFTMFSSGKSKFSPLRKRETLPMKNGVRWANFDSVLQRTRYTLVLQTLCTSPIWLSGAFFLYILNQHVSAFSDFQLFWFGNL